MLVGSSFNSPGIHLAKDMYVKGSQQSRYIIYKLQLCYGFAISIRLLRSQSPNASLIPEKGSVVSDFYSIHGENLLGGSYRTSQVNGQTPSLSMFPFTPRVLKSSVATSIIPLEPPRHDKTPCYLAPFFLLIGITSSGSSPFLKAAIKSCILPSTLSSSLQQASSTPIAPSSHISSTLRTIFCLTPT